MTEHDLGGIRLCLRNLGGDDRCVLPLTRTGDRWECPAGHAWDRNAQTITEERSHKGGPNLDVIAAQIPCRHNDLPIYDRPWRRLFRKRYLWICIRCDRTRPRSPGSVANDGDRPTGENS